MAGTGVQYRRCSQPAIYTRRGTSEPAQREREQSQFAAISTLYYVITASMLPLTGRHCVAAPLCWTAISYVIVGVSSPGANAEDIC